MNISFSLMEIVIIFVVVIIAEMVKPLAFKVKFLKSTYPFIVMLMTIGLSVFYAVMNNSLNFDVVLKGIILGGISSWCYDAIIAKVKNFIK